MSSWSIPSAPKSGPIITPDISTGKPRPSEGSREASPVHHGWSDPTAPNPYHSDMFLFIREAPSFPFSLLYLLGAEKETVTASGTHNSTNRQKLLHRQTDVNPEGKRKCFGISEREQLTPASVRDEFRKVYLNWVLRGAQELAGGAEAFRALGTACAKKRLPRGRWSRCVGQRAMIQRQPSSWGSGLSPETWKHWDREEQTPDPTAADAPVRPLQR